MANADRDSALVTIANGQSLSDAADVRRQRIVGILMPASWTTASLTFQGSHDGTTYRDVYDGDGNELTVPAAASRAIGLNAEQQLTLCGWNFLKVRSGTAGSAVNQGAARELTLTLEPL